MRRPHIRFSCAYDKEALLQAFRNYYGKGHEGESDFIIGIENGRYLLYMDELYSEILAFSGLRSHSIFAYELDWCGCSEKSDSVLGLRELLNRLIKLACGSSIIFYTSRCANRGPDIKQIFYGDLSKNFRLIQSGVQYRRYGLNCGNSCPACGTYEGYSVAEGCCYVDMYALEGKNTQGIWRVSPNHTIWINNLTSNIRQNRSILVIDGFVAKDSVILNKVARLLSGVVTCDIYVSASKDISGKDPNFSLEKENYSKRVYRYNCKGLCPRKEKGLECSCSLNLYKYNV